MRKYLCLILMLLLTGCAAAETVAGQSGMWEIEISPEWRYLGFIPARGTVSYHEYRMAETGSRPVPPASLIMAGTPTSSDTDVFLLDKDIFDAIVTIGYCNDYYRGGTRSDIRNGYPYCNLDWDVDVESIVRVNDETYPRYLKHDPDYLGKYQEKDIAGNKVYDMTFQKTHDPEFWELLRFIELPDYTLCISLRTNRHFEEEATQAMEELMARLLIWDNGALKPLTE